MYPSPFVFEVIFGSTVIQPKQAKPTCLMQVVSYSDEVLCWEEPCWEEKTLTVGVAASLHESPTVLSVPIAGIDSCHAPVGISLFFGGECSDVLAKVPFG